MLHAMELFLAYLRVSLFGDWARFFFFTAAINSGEVDMLLCIAFRLRFNGFFDVFTCNGQISVSTKAELMARDKEATPIAGVGASQVGTFSLADTSGTLASMTIPRWYTTAAQPGLNKKMD